MAAHSIQYSVVHHDKCQAHQKVDCLTPPLPVINLTLKLVNEEIEAALVDPKNRALDQPPVMGLTLNCVKWA